jgi:hypothetical protein
MTADGNTATASWKGARMRRLIRIGTVTVLSLAVLGTAALNEGVAAQGHLLADSAWGPTPRP